MSDDVLRYTQEKVSQGTVRRAYARWRAEQGLPDRCDEPKCCFYAEPLIWNGRSFKLILDHKNGNNSDNRPKNLRYLCPICNSQLDTHGGGNKGRVEKSSGGFAILDKESGLRRYTLPVEAGHYELRGGCAALIVQRNDERAEMSAIRVQLFKHSYQPFCDLLKQHGIDYANETYEPGQLFSSGTVIHILCGVGGGAVLASLAMVVRAYLQLAASRKVQITLKNDSIEFVTQGFSEDQVKSLLSQARSMMVIDTEKAGIVGSGGSVEAQ